MSRLHCAVEGLVISLIVRYLFLDNPYLSIHYFVILLMRKYYACACVDITAPVGTLLLLYLSRLRNANLQNDRMSRFFRQIFIVISNFYYYLYLYIPK